MQLVKHARLPEPPPLLAAGDIVVEGKRGLCAFASTNLVRRAYSSRELPHLPALPKRVHACTLK